MREITTPKSSSRDAERLVDTLKPSTAGYAPLKRVVAELPSPRKRDVEPSQQPRTGSGSQDEASGLVRVQFTAPTFICQEDEMVASLDVMRIGNVSGSSKVQLRTVDGSATAPLKYQAVTTEVSFGPGECLKSVQVPIVQDDFFDTTLEFTALLERAQRCTIGSTLGRCRVLIADTDCFPANEFKDIGSDEDALDEVTVSLLVAFIRLTLLRVPTIWWKAGFTILVDQLHNVYYILRVLLQVYLVDVVLNLEDTKDTLIISGNRVLTAALVALLYTLPQLLLIVADRLKVDVLDMGKVVCTHLQVNLFRRYLNYTEDSKLMVPVQELNAAMDADIPMLVREGFLSLFSMLRNTGKIFVVCFFLLRSDWRAIGPIILYPILILYFISARQAQNVLLEAKAEIALTDAGAVVVNAVDSFRLIRDYSQRSAVSVVYEDLVEKSFGEQIAVDIFQFWNTKFVPTITSICVGLYLLFGAQMVLMGDMPLGEFIAMLGVLQELGDRFQGLYENLQQGVSAGSPLVVLTRFLNLPTDVNHRIRRAKARREFLFKTLRSEGTTQRPDGTICIPRDSGAADLDSTVLFDEVPLVVGDMQIGHLPSLRHVHAGAHVPIGHLVFITGPHGSGKNSVIRFIADLFSPEHGVALFSPYNRIIHVSQVPEVMNHLSLYENLTFGDKYPTVKRVLRMIHRLDLDRSSWFMDELRSDPAVAAAIGAGESEALGEPTKKPPEGPADEESRAQQWHQRLSRSELKKLHLVRALNFNADIMVMHNFVDEADSCDVSSLLALLREFVDNRGVELDPAKLKARRPRVCFFSGGDHGKRTGKSLAAADVIWRLTTEGLSVESSPAEGEPGPEPAPPPQTLPPLTLANPPESMPPPFLVKKDQPFFTTSSVPPLALAGRLNGASSSPPARVGRNVPQREWSARSDGSRGQTTVQPREWSRYSDGSTPFEGRLAVLPNREYSMRSEGTTGSLPREGSDAPLLPTKATPMLSREGESQPYSARSEVPLLNSMASPRDIDSQPSRNNKVPAPLLRSRLSPREDESLGISSRSDAPLLLSSRYKGSLAHSQCNPVDLLPDSARGKFPCIGMRGV